MLLGTIIQGRRYSFGEYGAASLLVLGIVLFTMGDVDTLPTFDPKGVVLITVALFLDSAAGNFEERRFFNIPNPVSHAEVVFHANLIGICFTTTIMLCSGELLPAISHAATHTNVTKSHDMLTNPNAPSNEPPTPHPSPYTRPEPLHHTP